MNEIIVHQPTKSEFKRMAMQLGYEPVRHGHWKDKIGGYWDSVKCSVCGERFPSVGGKLNYCPNCGAKMDEVSE